MKKLFVRTHRLQLANVDSVIDVMSATRQQLPCRCLVTRAHFGRFSSDRLDKPAFDLHCWGLSSLV